MQAAEIGLFGIIFSRDIVGRKASFSALNLSMFYDGLDCMAVRKLIETVQYTQKESHDHQCIWKH